MPKKLTPDQVETYRRDGFLAAQPALTPAEVAHYRASLETYEAGLRGRLTSLPPMHARKTHVLLHWAAELVRHPALLDAIEDLIGPDILIFNATFFIKEARADGITAWHQDSTYFGLEPQEHVTCWVAFSDASLAAGCMEFLPGSHNWGQLNRAARAVANSINFGNQSITGEFDADAAVAVPVRAGEFSCHHTRTLHQSGPNATDDRRIGLGISYIPAHVHHKGSMRMPATLVRGANRYGHFDLEPDPRALTPEQAAQAHEAAYRGYRAGYNEQIERHAAAFATGSA
jgi:non-heme Fe2+,alpha-ketoglutarate-dependent halogenase